MNFLLIASSEDSRVNLLEPMIAAFSSRWLRVNVPMGAWLRRPQWPRVQDLLDEARLKCERNFAPASVRQKWAEHVSESRKRRHQLLYVLMFLGIGSLEDASRRLQ